MSNDFYFDLEKLKKPQDYENLIGVNRKITTIHVRKPRKQEFFQIHSDGNYYLKAHLLHLNQDNHFYYVKETILQNVLGELVLKHLFTCINRQNDIFIWPISDLNENRKNPWVSSALIATIEAKKEWIKIAPNYCNQSYDIFRPNQKLSDPIWPDISFQEILNIAFRDFNIDRIDHPILKNIRGDE